jgi:hypothetical protein
MPKIVRPKIVRASNRSRGELTGAARSSVELDMAAWCHVLEDQTKLAVRR